MNTHVPENINDEALNKIDKIQDLIARMSSGNDTVASTAMAEADSYLEKAKTNIDKSQINHYIETKPLSDVSTAMKEFARDAEQRHAARQARKRKAEQFKAKANDYFKAGDWTQAVSEYTRAIDLCKDWEILYTNRAQAYLKLGKCVEAITDCDFAIRIGPEKPVVDSANVQTAITKNTTASKAYLHRGKALVNLGRAEEALEAYATSRWFCMPKPAQDCPRWDSSGHTWPEFLRDYAKQARESLAMQSRDREVQFVTTDLEGESNAAKFCRLFKSELNQPSLDLTTLARVKEHAACLLSMSKILRESVQIFDEDVNETKNSRAQRRIKSKKKDGSDSPSEPQVSPTTSNDQNNNDTLSLKAKLQSWFRSKTGFKLLKEDAALLLSHVTFIEFGSLEMGLTMKFTEGCPFVPTDNRAEVQATMVQWLNGLLSLTLQLILDDCENKRLLCLAQMKDFIRNLLLKSVQFKCPSNPSVLQTGSQLLYELTQQPGGAKLFVGLFSEQENSDIVLKSLCVAVNLSIEENFTRPVTYLAQCLEALAQLPGFLDKCVNSQPLLRLVESALDSKSTVGLSPSLLARLLDILGSACASEQFRKNLLKYDERLLFFVVQRLADHASLVSDVNHASLVGSCCRFLYNLLVSSTGNQLKARLLNKILNSAGLVLDEPKHGPELRTVCVALVGRLLPMCSNDENTIKTWCGEKSPEDSIDLSERCKLLLDCLDHGRAPLIRKSLTTVSQNCSSSNGNNSSKREEESQQKERNLLLHGSLRALATIVPHVKSVRFAIGDDRTRCRKLALLTRAKKVTSLEEEHEQQMNRQKCLGPAPPKHDSILAGNACLVLMNCCDDTPMAEHLIDTSVMQDLMALVQDSGVSDCKNNASILASRLAMANQTHREELHKLGGMGLLNRVNYQLNMPYYS